MSKVELTEEDRILVRDILHERVAAGEENPLLPLDVDLNGDGITDAFGLDVDGEVILVFGVPLDQTSYESDGDDIEQFEAVQFDEPLDVEEED